MGINLPIGSALQHPTVIAREIKNAAFPKALDVYDEGTPLLQVYKRINRSLKPEPDVRTVSNREFSINKINKVVIGDDDFYKEAVDFIKRQKDEIIVSNFHITMEGPGRGVVEALAEAQKRGVNVKVLADRATGFKKFAQRSYNREKAEEFLKNNGVKLLHYRGDLLGPVQHNHNKLMIGDRSELLFGGSNIFHKTNMDYDLLVTGPIVRDCLIKFNEDWFISGGNYEVNVKDNAPKFNELSKDTARMKLYVDNPIESSIVPAILDSIKNSKKSIDISMMLICELGHKDFFDALTDAKNRGVKVRILTDAREEFKTFTVHTMLNGHIVDKLVQNGIPTRYYDYNNNDKGYWQLHSKLIIVDDEEAFLGSANLNTMAQEEINEVMVSMKDNKEAIKVLKDSFEHNWKNNSFYKIFDEMPKLVLPSKIFNSMAAPPNYTRPIDTVNPNDYADYNEYVKAQAKTQEEYQAYKKKMEKTALSD